ncbi:MAG: chemotaxis-specific protein-glutamate methyltransferase CheB [Glaciecola sp.]
MAKVLIVDDSALMRKHLRSIFESAGFDTEIARNGEECLEKIPHVKPDAITLDINMPVMDGITCLSLIMAKHPTPVVMVSSLTEKGALATFEALELGAVDYVPKPSGTVSLNLSESAEVLLDKVRSAIKTRIGKRSGLRSKIRVKREQTEVQIDKLSQHKFTLNTGQKDVVLIGVSTGGPGCLQTILQDIPASFTAPIVVSQHMPAKFTQVFAERLNKRCQLNVQEVSAPTALKPGNVYIAQGDADVKIMKRNNTLMASSISADNTLLWHPSVDKLVQSALTVVNPKKLLCVQLTGMGNDGAESMFAAYKRGATTIAESEETAVVYGMPRDLVLRGGATIELPNTQIANAIMNAVG